jgi:hypothetical protein
MGALVDGVTLDFPGFYGGSFGNWLARSASNFLVWALT